MKRNIYGGLAFLFILVTFFFSLSENVHASSIAGKKEVTKENFEEYFGLRDATFDKSMGVVTLTPDGTKDYFGSFYLSERISSKADFTLVGKVHLGTKTDLKNGGDGIGFAFYSGDVGQLGYSGNGLGIAGIKNAVGFKLDTYYNHKLIASDGYTTAIGKLGYDSDWIGLGKPEGRAETPFGGFVTTDGDKGYMTNDYSSNQALTPRIDYLNVIAKDIPIKFEMKSGTLSVTLNEGANKLTWTKTVNPQKSFSFHIAGATGQGTNKQTFTFDEFQFTPVKKVTVQEEWVGDEGTGARPTSAGFTLIKTIDGVEQTPTEEDHYVVGEGESWSKILDNLPELTSDQKEIFYKIKADEITNYDTEVTSVPTKSNMNLDATRVNSEEAPVEKHSGETFTITNTYKGTLALQSVPEILTWKDRLIPRPGDILSRDSGNEMAITVSDTRKGKSAWKINASVDNSDSGLYSFVFKNKKDEEPVELNGKEVLNDSTATLLDDGTTYQGTWGIDAGVLLRANDYIPIGSYEKNETITWNLVSTALAD